MTTALETVPPYGLILDRYRPIRPLGSGGSGSVWLARDEDMGLEVALKIVTREGKAASRAEREAQAAAQLRHPNCLRAYGFESDTRHVYIAYEYVPGRTLRHELRGGLGDETALEATAQVLDALAFAHANGIVHRDVKPSNVLVAECEEVSVRLFDFGLAQLADSETLTATGDVPGTLAYIAPERLAGEPAGPAADVWAVGVLLWEALAGRHPFWKLSPIETGRQIQLGAPSLSEARPDLPQTVLDAVDRALSVDPERRPTAADLARRLRGAFHEPARRRAPRVALKVPDFRRLRRAVPAGLAALSAGWTAAALPFYPARWPLLLAGLAAVLTAWRPRLGLAFVLAVPIFPFGNVSLGLALVYTAVAVLWLAIAWGEPESGLAFGLGPLLAPLGLLGLLPLLLQRVRGAVRRAAYALGALLAAGLVAGLRGIGLPVSGESPPPSLGLAGEEDPLAVAGELWALIGAHGPIARTAVVVALAAAVLPSCLRRGELWIAGLSAGLLAAVLVVAPEASPWPFVAAAWVTCAALLFQWRLRGGEAARIPRFDAVSRPTRARFRVRLKAGGGPGWPQRTALARRR